MSAWQLTGKHIAVMVDASIMVGAYRTLYPGETPDESKRRETCKMLAEENAASVNYRYQGEYAEIDGKFQRIGSDAVAVNSFPKFNHKVLKEYPLMVLLKAIDCYEYQSCEHEGWKDSEARKFCARLRKALIQNSPEYANCPGWGLT